MHITLIGMSNIGKTHWARRLEAESGFARIDCDQMIENKIGPEMTRLGHKGIAGVAKWMGQPFDPQYPETSRAFLDYEKTVMEEVLRRLRFSPRDQSLVIDTSGSVIYASDAIITPLRALTKVIYFEASRAHADKILARYVSDPKPLVWGDNAFAPRTGEKPDEALKRCYPDLLESRARRYAEMAHVTVPFEKHRDPNAGLDIILGRRA
jgi:shikimate kinase